MAAVANARCILFGCTVTAFASSAGAGAGSGATMKAGPSLLSSLLRALNRSGAEASRGVKGANGNSFRRVAIMEVWSNAASLCGRTTDPAGIQGEISNAGTRTPYDPKSKPSGEGPPGETALGGST